MMTTRLGFSLVSVRATRRLPVGVSNDEFFFGIFTVSSRSLPAHVCVLAQKKKLKFYYEKHHRSSRTHTRRRARSFAWNGWENDGISRFFPPHLTLHPNLREYSLSTLSSSKFHAQMIFSCCCVCPCDFSPSTLYADMSPSLPWQRWKYHLASCERGLTSWARERETRD